MRDKQVLPSLLLNLKPNYIPNFRNNKEPSDIQVEENK